MNAACFLPAGCSCACAWRAYTHGTPWAAPDPEVMWVFCSLPPPPLPAHRPPTPPLLPDCCRLCQLLLHVRRGGRAMLCCRPLSPRLMSARQLLLALARAASHQSHVEFRSRRPLARCPLVPAAATRTCTTRRTCLRTTSARGRTTMRACRTAPSLRARWCWMWAPAAASWPSSPPRLVRGRRGGAGISITRLGGCVSGARCAAA